MTYNLFQGGSQYNHTEGSKPKGKLPGPRIQALKQGSEGGTMSDLQFMLHNERKQHEQNYIYENGHNDHGMGQ